MALDRIALSDFRNHRHSALEGTARFNLLIGENGAGKTNVLEAISLFAPGRGLRRAALADMACQNGNGAFAVSATLGVQDALLKLGTGTAGEALTRRRVRVNGADAAATSLAQWLGIFWLTPAMDRLFADSPSARRRFLDRLVLALNPPHAACAARMEAALRERNRLLATPGTDARWFAGVEAQLAAAGAAVAQGRADLIARLDAALSALPPSPFARPRLGYRPGGPLSAEGLAEALADGRRRDIAAGRTLTGPHRDDIAVTHAEKDQPAADCSTGEQKAMLIAMTLAHAEMTGDRADDAPHRPRLLLLDEVAAHLDPIRRAALFERLAGTGAQIWMTGTESAPFADLARHAPAIWRVDGGTVRRVDG